MGSRNKRVRKCRSLSGVEQLEHRVVFDGELTWVGAGIVGNWDNVSAWRKVNLDGSLAAATASPQATDTVWLRSGDQQPFTPDPRLTADEEIQSLWFGRGEMKLDLNSHKLTINAADAVGLIVGPRQVPGASNGEFYAPPYVTDFEVTSQNEGTIEVALIMVGAPFFPGETGEFGQGPDQDGARLQVMGKARVEADKVVISQVIEKPLEVNNDGGKGFLRLGDESELSVSNLLEIAKDADGFVILEAKSSLIAKQVLVGAALTSEFLPGPGRVGYLLVENASSTDSALIDVEKLIVGKHTQGTVVVGSHGRLKVSEELVIGNIQQHFSSSVTLTGARSLVSGKITIGGASELTAGRLVLNRSLDESISQAAQAFDGGELRIGDSLVGGLHGVVRVDGTATRLDTTVLAVDKGTTAFLEIEGGAYFSTRKYSDDPAIQQLTLTKDDNSGVLIADENLELRSLIVGSRGSAEMSVSEASTLDLGNLILGERRTDGVSGKGVARVDFSTVNVADRVIVGSDGGEGELTIDNGSVVQSFDAVVARIGNAKGAVRVVGNSTWNIESPYKQESVGKDAAFKFGVGGTATVHVEAGSAINLFRGGGIHQGVGGRASGAGKFALNNVNGTIGNYVTNGTGAVIAPGDSPIGTLTIEGEFDGSDGFTLELDLATTGISDVLDISGQAQLSGILSASSLDNANLAYVNGDRFEVLNAASIVGEFDELELPTLTAGLRWDVQYGQLDGDSEEEVWLVVEQIPPPKLASTIRDFTTPHPDFYFNTGGGLKTGLVGSTLTADYDPYFTGDAGEGGISSTNSFDQWYRDVPGVNAATGYEMQFAETSPGVYKFNQPNFFPIDGQLLGNEGRSHNFLFTLETHASFQFTGDEYFTITSDDDLWLYVNGQLALDIGGHHTAVTRSVNLASLGLVEGETYDVDLFYAERNVTKAVLVVETNALLNDRNIVDTTAPTPTNSPDTLVDNQVTLAFDGRLQLSTAENVANYVLDGGVSVLAAVLSGDGRAVTLTTSALAVGTEYTVTMNGLFDVAGNVIATDTQTTFTYLPFVNGDIGAVATAGSTVVEDGVFTIKASGADIWGSNDEFHFVHQSLSGDGEIIARVASLENVDAFTKAGVMIRESLAANAREVGVVLTPAGRNNGVRFQSRTATGGSTTTTSFNTTISAPGWVKLNRTGNVFTAYFSFDGETWTQLGAPRTVVMSSEVYIGLAATSHQDGTLATAVIDQVSITTPMMFQSMMMARATQSGAIESTATGDGVALFAAMNEGKAKSKENRAAKFVDQYFSEFESQDLPAFLPEIAGTLFFDHANGHRLFGENDSIHESDSHVEDELAFAVGTDF